MKLATWSLWRLCALLLLPLAFCVAEDSLSDVQEMVRMSMVTVTAAPKNLQDSSNMDTLRIIRSYASSIYLQCPLQSKLNNEVIAVHQLKWVNEMYEFNKPDLSVVVTPQNLVGAGLVNFQLNDRLNYVSCG